MRLCIQVGHSEVKSWSLPSRKHSRAQNYLKSIATGLVVPQIFTSIFAHALCLEPKDNKKTKIIFIFSECLHTSFYSCKVIRFLFFIPQKYLLLPGMSEIQHVCQQCASMTEKFRASPLAFVKFIPFALGRAAHTFARTSLWA